MLTLAKIKAKQSELKKTWAPVARVLFVVSICGFIKTLLSRTGPFLWVSIAFLFLASATILFVIPDKSIDRVARRLVAFALDVAILSVLTVAFVGLLFRTVIQPSALVSMLIVWVWFLFFVLFDWLLKATPGKLIVGLKLRRYGKGSVTVAWSLAYNFLLLVVPLLLAGWIDGLESPSESHFRMLTRVSAWWAILLFFPFSIVVSGGQSLPDLLFGISVSPKKAVPEEHRIAWGRREWMLLLLTSFSMGVVLSGAFSILDDIVKGKPLPPAQKTSSITDSELGAQVWVSIAVGLRDAERYLQYVDVRTEERTTPSEGEGSELTTPLHYEDALAATRFIRVIRAWITPGTPNLIKAKLHENLLTSYHNHVPRQDRPVFVVFRVLTIEDYGAFSLSWSDESILCLMDSGGRPANFFVTGDQTVLVQSAGSPLVMSTLLRGKLGEYSALNHIAVLPR